MRKSSCSRAAVLLVLLLVAPGVGTSAGAAAVLPDAETLLALSAAAAGPVPANFRETIVGGGTSRTMFHRNNDVRTVIDRGPVHTEDGVYRGAAWHQDANGVTVLDEGVGGLPALPPTDTSVRRVTDPVPGYLVETRDARGYVRQIVDAATLQVVRTERTDAGGTVVTTYDDFALFGARRLPAHWTISDSRTNTTTIEERTGYGEGVVSESDVTVPAARRDLVTFPAGARAVTLPARFVRDRIYVQVAVAGRNLDFVLDTGEPGIAIAEATARDLGLPLFNQRRQFAAGPFAQYDTVVPLVAVGPLTMHDVVMTTIPEVPQQSHGQTIAGILGFDFLARLGVTIDYAGAHVVVAPAARWTRPTGQAAVRVPVRLLNGVPLVRVALNGQIGERFVLDTGATTSVLVTNAFARGHGKVFVGHGTPEPYAGLGGSFDVNRYRVRDVAIERIAFRDINVLRADATDPYAAIDGLIGTSLLHFFTLDLHYADGTVYLTRNALEPRATRHACTTATAAWNFRASDCMGTDDSDAAIAG